MTTDMMKNIIKFILEKNGYIISNDKNQIIFMLCNKYYYIVRKINNKYIITKNKKDKNNYIVISPEIKRDTQKEIIFFLKAVRN